MFIYAFLNVLSCAYFILWQLNKLMNEFLKNFILFFETKQESFYFSSDKCSYNDQTKTKTQYNYKHKSPSTLPQHSPIIYNFDSISLINGNGKFKANSDYFPCDANHLSFRKNDSIVVIDKINEELWVHFFFLTNFFHL